MPLSSAIFANRVSNDSGNRNVLLTHLSACFISNIINTPCLALAFAVDTYAIVPTRNEDNRHDYDKFYRLLLHRDIVYGTLCHAQCFCPCSLLCTSILRPTSMSLANLTRFVELTF
jgi:hypothetical protein